MSDSGYGHEDISYMTHISYMTFHTFQHSCRHFHLDVYELV